VDTSNELGGEGLTPHSSIGNARRMMVPSLDAQAKVMIECVQVSEGVMSIFQCDTVSELLCKSSGSLLNRLLNAELLMVLYTSACIVWLSSLAALYACLISLHPLMFAPFVSLMTEFQNHTPQVMVIDEIGRSAEVSAVATVKARGVRMVASAHGSFKELYHNTQLKGLLGTFVPVKRIHSIHTYSANVPPARHSLYVCIVVVQSTNELDTTKTCAMLLCVTDLSRCSSRQRLLSLTAQVHMIVCLCIHMFVQVILEKGVPKVERTSKPIFPVIVETSRASYDTWIVIHNVDDAVVSIMKNVPFEAERRTRDTVTGAVTTAKYMYTV
jgi:hypothetical protein